MNQRALLEAERTLQNALGDLFGAPVRTDPPLALAGLDPVGALWLQGFVQERFGTQLKPAALLEMSIEALAHTLVARQRSAPQRGGVPQPGREEQEARIAAQLLEIAAGELVSPEYSPAKPITMWCIILSSGIFGRT